MSGLISSSQMAALSSLVKKGMTTDAYIQDHVISDSVDGTSESWVERSASVKCWFYTTPQTALIVDHGVQVIPNQLRIFFELGTDIDAGDRVRVDSQVFTVIDTSRENTIQAMLTVYVRSRD